MEDDDVLVVVGGAVAGCLYGESTIIEYLSRLLGLPT